MTRQDPLAGTRWQHTTLALSPLLLLATSALLGIAVAALLASTWGLSRHGAARIAARWSSLRPHARTLELMFAATWISALDLLLAWRFPGLRETLGPYAALIVGTVLVLTLLPASAPPRGAEHRVGRLLLALPTLSGAVRELLGTGRLLGDLGLLVQTPFAGLMLAPGAPLPLMTTPPGGLLLLAAMLAWRPTQSSSP